MLSATERLNKQYSQVKIGGKVRYWDGEDFLVQQDFLALEAGKGEWSKDGKKFIADTAVWLTSNNRNLYRKAMFYPGEVPDDTFNLWQGWSVEPKKGNWSLFRTHIFKNICDSRRDYCDWLIQWMAQIVQHPEEKLGTAIALVGGKGCGKSIYAEIFGGLCKQNYVPLIHGDSVISKFNSVYENCIICNVDEAVWAGDKKGESIIKGLITAPRLRIERKGLEGYMAQNYTRLIFTTNDDWAVNASEDERRYFILRVGDSWTGNTSMFKAMFKQMEHGGYAGLMYDLLHTTLHTKNNLRKPPITREGKNQRIMSESPYLQYWRDKVSNTAAEDWPDKIMKEVLASECMQYFKDHNIKKPFHDGAFFKQLRRVLPPWEPNLWITGTDGRRKRCINLPEHRVCTDLLS